MQSHENGHLLCLNALSSDPRIQVDQQDSYDEDPQDRSLVRRIGCLQPEEQGDHCSDGYDRYENALNVDVLDERFHFFRGDCFTLGHAREYSMLLRTVVPRERRFLQ